MINVFARSRAKKIDSHQRLVEAVDSLELLKAQSLRTSCDKPEQLMPSNSLESRAASLMPSYMKAPSKSRCSGYVKMSKREWSKLEHAAKSSRMSSVHFDGIQQPGATQKNSRNSSILKPPLAVESNQINPELNVVQTVHEKCREAIQGMDVESLLLMLCDDN